MMKKNIKNVKIYGAGSIGNHMANAARFLGAGVDVIDVDPLALERMKNDIYPSRYGSWDEEIGLYEKGFCPVRSYDLIVIGTPPDTHLDLAIEACDSSPKAILIEKPLCALDMRGLRKLREKAKKNNIRLFVGYDHVVGKASQFLGSCLKSDLVGEVLTLDVEFREHWGGIFEAHPWLSSPLDSYLGHSKLGGGASGEHSHALNFWQHISHLVGGGRIAEVDALFDFGGVQALPYDRACFMNLSCASGLIGRCVQDVITSPAKKWAMVQGTKGRLEWHCSYEPNADKVTVYRGSTKAEEKIFKKTRPDDFIMELNHINDIMGSHDRLSPIDIQFGIQTMDVLLAAHKSYEMGRRTTVSYFE
ncbi:Gfo/Idh/MocA family oxidoreductase [Alphaproteobacteria bacterium]|nr:Gfo/Idh/MocA family oxidoreductase [Alphaproteobacteria bacterium]